MLETKFHFNVANEIDLMDSKFMKCSTSDIWNFRYYEIHKKKVFFPFSSRRDQLGTSASKINVTPKGVRKTAVNCSTL